MLASPHLMIKAVQHFGMLN